MSKEQENRPLVLTLEQVGQLAREVALRDGGHSPIIIMEGSLNLAICAVPLLGNNHDMRLAGYAFGQRANIGEPQQAFFVSEGWMGSGIEGELPPGKPSEESNRLGVLFVNHFLLKTNEVYMLAYEMVRAQDNKLIDLRPLFDLEQEAGRTQKFLLNVFVEEFKTGRQARYN